MSIFTRATLYWDDAKRGFEAGARVDLKPAFKQLKKPLRLDQRDHAKQKRGPESAWAPRAESTIARALRGRHGSKKLLGRLPTAVSYIATALSVRGVSRAPWSAAHAKGERVGHGAKLPPREFLWISDAMLTTATSTLADALARAFGGK